MYLGKDAGTGNPMFLDFTTSKPGRGEFWGRIFSEEEFLRDNIGHKEFDVYRLNVDLSFDIPMPVEKLQKAATDSPIPPEKLFTAARDIAVNKSFGTLIDCANAVSRVLSAATGHVFYRSGAELFHQGLLPSCFDDRQYWRGPT